MDKSAAFVIYFISLLGIVSCKKSEKDFLQKQEIHSRSSTTLSHISIDNSPLMEGGYVRAIIEIPSGSVEKWEINKSTGEIQHDSVNNAPRVINFLGYPGNYGMIPGTLLPKEKGGDGDPLDVIVLGPPAERGSFLKTKIIGILHLNDRGEQDDKLIAISENSSFQDIDDLNDLANKHGGLLEILQLWFTNYKGAGIVSSKGYGDKEKAMSILLEAIEEHKLSKQKSN